MLQRGIWSLWTSSPASSGLIEDLTWGWAPDTLSLSCSACFITVMSGFVQVEFFTRMFRVLSRQEPDRRP